MFTTIALPHADENDRPLERFELIRVDDVDSARGAVGDAFCRHRLTPLGRGEDFTARFHGVELGGVGLYYLEYGSTVRIEPTEFEDFYLAQIPLTGDATIEGRDWDLASGPGMGSILQPADQVRMQWQAGNRQLLVRIDAALLHDQLRRRLGRVPKVTLRFDSALDVSQPMSAAWIRLVDALADSLDLLGADSGQLAIGEMGTAVVNQLLLSQSNSYSAELQDGSPAAAVPRTIRAAAHILSDRADRQVHIPDLAAEVGVSVRALQSGFRTYLDCSPTEYLRRIRLERVRSELLEADSTSTTVADLAMRWGFVHQGRFAATYRAAFGETPAATLRR